MDPFFRWKIAKCHRTSGWLIVAGILTVLLIVVMIRSLAVGPRWAAELMVLLSGLSTMVTAGLAVTLRDDLRDIGNLVRSGETRKGER